MSEETVWQGLAAILPIFHWTVLRLTYKFQGRDFRLTDVHGRVVQAILA